MSTVRICSMQLRRSVKAARWFATGPLRRLRYLSKEACRRLASGLHWTTEFDGDGGLDCADSVVIGRRTRLSVPRRGRLILRKGAWLGDDCEIGVTGAISIGSYTSLQDRSIVLGDVTIGAGCACGSNMYISSSWHHFEDTPEYPIRWQDARASSVAFLAARSRAVVVGDDCWIGINVVITPGVNVGRGCVIGANSVVTKDLPPYSVATGAPAKVLRKRLDFSPPSSLRANRIEHIPYFYRGFIQWGSDIAGLDQALDKGGWPAEDAFTIAINAGEGAGMEMSVRAMLKGTLSHGAQILDVVPGESTLFFAAEPGIDGLLEFKWSPIGVHAVDATTLVVLAVDKK
jgi:acetyltransferase-like isoleucine patch superfamily enzyme